MSRKPLNSGVCEADLESFSFLGEGSLREVLVSDKFEGVVIKRQHKKSDKSNLRELKVWAEMIEEGYGHLVPKHDAIYLSSGELVLCVEYIEFTDDSVLLSAQTCSSLLIANQFTPDATPGENSGYTSDGRFILRDAA